MMMMIIDKYRNIENCYLHEWKIDRDLYNLCLKRSNWLSEISTVESEKKIIDCLFL